MKTALGLATCACLALSLAAFADKAERPRYKANGDLCTVEEVASMQMKKARPVKIRSVERRTGLVIADCRTKAEWSLASAAESERQRDADRYWTNRLGLANASPYDSSPSAYQSAIATRPPGIQ